MCVRAKRGRGGAWRGAPSQQPSRRASRPWPPPLPTALAERSSRARERACLLFVARVNTTNPHNGVREREKKGENRSKKTAALTLAPLTVRLPPCCPRSAALSTPDRAMPFDLIVRCEREGGLGGKVGAKGASQAITTSAPNPPFPFPSPASSSPKSPTSGATAWTATTTGSRSTSWRWGKRREKGGRGGKMVARRERAVTDCFPRSPLLSPGRPPQRRRPLRRPAARAGGGQR